MGNSFTIQHSDIYCGDCNKGITFADALNHAHFDFRAIADDNAESGADIDTIATAYNRGYKDAITILRHKYGNAAPATD